jgi:hypothetical protein
MVAGLGFHFIKGLAGVGRPGQGGDGGEGDGDTFHFLSPDV